MGSVLGGDGAVGVAEAAAASEAEAAEVAARIEELSRAAEAAQGGGGAPPLSAEQTQELRELQEEMERMRRLQAAADAVSQASEQCAEARARVETLLQKQKRGEALTAEEEAELRRLEAEAAALEQKREQAEQAAKAAARELGGETGASSRRRRKGKAADGGGEDDNEPVASTAEAVAPGGGKKRMRTSEIVPAGRMVTLTRLRATDVPDVDRKGGASNVADPYLILNVLSASGAKLDEARTEHLDNQTHPRWSETVRLFVPDDDLGGKSKTPPVKLLVTLMDYNKKTDDVLIGDVPVSLPVGAGKIKVEVPSRSVSMARPHVYFRYEATPQMYFEQVEWVRVAAERADQPPDEGETDGMADGENTTVGA